MKFSQFSGQHGGRRLRIGPGVLSPFIKWMLIINGAVFLLQFFFRGQLEYYLGLTPALFFADFPNYLYSVFTYMFLHSTSGIFHLLINMFILWMFGTEIELTWGSRSFARFYLLAGFCGGVLTLLVHPGQAGPTIGASGAVYGILVAYWLMFPRRYLYLWFLFPVQVRWAIPALMLISFLSSDMRVAHMAHLGGALFGLAYLKLDWRLFSFGRRFKTLRHKRAETKLHKNRLKAEDVMKKVDSILDRINEVGIENLSKSERKFLEEASSELADRKKDPERK